mgnify:FL=1
MEYSNVAEIFAANAEIRKRFAGMAAGIPDHEASVVYDGAKWSIKQIIEHVAMVDQGITRICGKLISEAKRQGKFSNGTIAISSRFIQAIDTIGREKLEAPSQVQPTNNIEVADSLRLIFANGDLFESMRTDFETYELSEPTFPHPYFGAMTATEWLVLAGGHQMRHLRQIKGLLSTARQ